MNVLPVTDDQLVALVTKGDASALEQLYQRYVRQCFGLALRMLGEPAIAEEVVQEVFLKVWKQPDRYTAQKGRFATWLLSLVHNRSIDELRRRSRTEVPLEDQTGASILDTEPDTGTDPGMQVVNQEAQMAVREALLNIPAHQRQVLELAYFGGLSQSEIASKLQQPLGTIKTHMRTGIQRLRVLLEPYKTSAD